MTLDRKLMRYAHSDGHTDVCYSEDGRRLITCGIDGDIRIWSGFDDDDPVQTCIGEWALCVRQKGNQLAVATDSNIVQLMTFPEVERDGILVRFTAPINHMAVGKDHNFVVIGSEDMEVKIMNWNDPSELNTTPSLTGLTGPPLSVALSSDTNLVAVSSGDGMLRVWDIKSSALLKEIDCVPKVNSFMNAKLLCRIDFEPVRGKSLAYPTNSTVIIMNTSDWSTKLILMCPEIESPYSIVQFSPCGKYIAAASLNGDIVLWEVEMQDTIAVTKHPRSTAICALVWNPSGNGEIAYCDITGQLGIALLSRSEPTIESVIEVNENDGSNQVDFGEIQFEDDDDEDNENAVSLQQLKDDIMGTEGSELNFDQQSSRPSSPIRIPEIPMQNVFMPSSTPEHLNPRYLCWNDIGIVCSYGNDNDVDAIKSIEVEFHDISLHNSMMMQNYQGYTMASLSTAALAVAHVSQITVIPLSSGSKEWNLNTPDDEEIICIACSQFLVCFATANYLIRICSIYGTQKSVFSIPGPLVSLSANGNNILVAYHSASPRKGDQCINIMLVKAEGQAKHVCQENQLQAQNVMQSDNVSVVSNATSRIIISDIAEGDNNVNTNQFNNVKLPVLKIQTYKGEPEQFSCFYESFKSLVHNNDRESLEVSASNYPIALSLIERRYKNTKLIIQSHIKGIVDYPKITRESSIALRQFSDSLQAHLRALETLGEPVESWSTIIQYLVTDKLDYQSKKEWEIEVAKQNDTPDTEALIAFLEKRCSLLEKIEKYKVPQVTSAVQAQSLKSVRMQNSRVPNYRQQSFSHVSSQNECCPLCKGNHKIYFCKTFLDLSVSVRIAEVKKRKLCANCLRPGHFIADCRSGNCKRCNQQHSSLLHQDIPTHTPSSSLATPQVVQTNVASETNTTTLASHTKSYENSYQILPTAIILIYDNKGIPHQCTALLDSASMRSYMTISLCNRLHLETKQVNIPVSGISQIKAKISSITNTKIQSMYNDFCADLSFLLLQGITNRLPSHEGLELIELPENISLAYPRFKQDTKIDILLGVDIFWNLLATDQPFLEKYPFIHNTRLGYIVSGQFHTNLRKDAHTSCHLTTIELSKKLTQFWEIENVTPIKHFTHEERECESHFQQTTARDEQGRFIVSIPLNSSPAVLAESRQNALKQFLSLERRLQANQKIKNMYVDFMAEYEDLGHMKSIDESLDVAPYSYYIPHHGVYKESSLTTKLRVVLNSSAPSSNGLSLNDIQLNGPVLQDDLFSILVRLRRFKYVITADCSKMYRSILVKESQHPLQRIFWRADPSCLLNVYELCTVTYGEKASSFLAIRCLFELATQCETRHPNIANIIKRDMYCDDLLTSCQTLEEATYIFSTIFSILKLGGFTLRKWNSNHPEILQSVRSEDISNNILDCGPNENTKTLGLMYNSCLDVLFFSIQDFSSIKQPVTKRSVLSFIAMIFDPLGLLSPCTITAKIFMQQLWLTKIDWNEKLPQNLEIEWNQYCRDLIQLNSLRISRQVICDRACTLELHSFSDSSRKSYGACVYIRSIDNRGKVSVNLLCAKTRVSPLKVLTIPKLELCGALMMAQLVDKVKTSIDVNFNNIIYWTNSNIVLSWVKTQPHQLDTFIANRVSQIQQLCDTTNWRHIATSNNPADLLTRGVNPEKLSNLPLWFYGPSFLNDLKYETEAIPECLPVLVTTTTQSQSEPLEIIPFDKYSRLQKLKRIMAYCLRFIKNLRERKENRTAGPLTATELHNSLIRLASISQRESFQREIKQLTHDKTKYSKGILSTLNPFLDNHGTLRAGGRLANSSFEYEKKHPIIISAKHPFTKLLFRHKHETLLHAGPQQLLSTIRDQFWPIGGRNLAKKTAHTCLRCFKSRPKDIQNLLGNLPYDRVNPQTPFQVTGTDYCGPFVIKDRKGRGAKCSKCYVCLFICFSTKAVHLEPVTDLTSEAFISCLRRFASRRGIPAKIYSDNGRTYVGAHSQLKELAHFLINNKDNLESDLFNHNFNWSFIPPYSPNMGGIWEAGVKSTKFHLKRVIGDTPFTYEEFYTILVQIEGILNSRPLHPLSSDPSDFSPLTPSHFLTGRPITMVPDPSIVHIQENRLSLYQRLQQITQHFWRRWTKEYISELQQRFKWKDICQNVKLGTLVLLKDECLPPTKWRLGRVIQLYHGIDNIVRVVTIRTQSGATQRAISKICPLPIQENGA